MVRVCQNSLVRVSAGNGQNSMRNHYTLSELRKERGWSERLIGELLGEPDATKVNRRNRRGPLRRLYRRDRVHTAEQDARFVAYQFRREKRSKASKQTADKKRLELEAWAGSTPITVRRLPLDEVYKHSLQSRRAWAIHHSATRTRSRYVDFDGSNASAGVRDRWAVNYIRHELTAYDLCRLQAHGMVGVDRAVTVIRNRALTEIASAYPELAAECDRQRR
jgi:hypothetical protein